MSRYLVFYVAALLAGGTASIMAFREPQILGVQVVAMDDPTLSDRITELWVEVQNPGPQAVIPTFAVPANALRNWYAWEILEGPSELNAGSNATYHVRTPPYTGIPLSEGFRVVVNDVHHASLMGTSAIMRPHLPRPPPSVLNPGFGSWIPSMFHPDDLPYAWIPWVELHGQDSYDISGSDASARLRLHLDTSRTTGAQWSLVSLRQRVDFPSTLRIDFTEGNRSSYAVGARTEVGVTLEDVYGNTQVAVWFADPPTNADQAAAINLTLGPLKAHRVLVTNRSVELDLLQLYRDLGWHVPAQREVRRLLPHGPGDVGMGAASVMSAMDKLDIIRPMELKVLVASYPPHEHPELSATFSFVGGPAWDPAPSRFT